MCKNLLYVLLFCCCLSACSNYQSVCGFPHPCPLIRTRDYINFQSCLDKNQIIAYLKARDVGIIRYGDIVRIILPTDKFFDRDSVELNPEHACVIALIVQLIKRCPCCCIIITGHTDDVGTYRERLCRSHRYADTVAAHLWAQGIEWDRMCISGKADCAPISSDRTIFGSAENRRVEILLDCR